VVKPVLQALLLAERVYEDKTSGTKVICGVFNKIVGKAKPAEETDSRPTTKRRLRPEDVRQPGSPTAYINLTEVREKVLLELRYVSLRTHEVLLRAEVAVECHNPLQTVELVVPMPMLPVPHEGVYALELLWNDELLGSVRVTVEKAQPGPEEAK